MSAIRTWSEQGEAKWRDCMQASYLMALLYGGASIPNAYTVAERERFENAEGLPESQQEQGLVDYGPCDVAARALYGVAARRPSEDELPALLTSPDIAITLTGQGPGLPGGYAGPHSVCVLPKGGGVLDVYNPLNAMGAGPDGAAVARVLAWHRALPNDIRYLREDELMAYPFTPTTITGQVKVTEAHMVRDLVDGSLRGPYPVGTTWPCYGDATVDGTACWFVIPADADGHLCAYGKAVAGHPVGSFTPVIAPGQSHTVQLLVDGQAAGSIVTL